MKQHSCAAWWLRGGEIVLWITGLTLVGWALATILMVKSYQARQEAAYFPVAPTSEVSATTADPAAKAGADPLFIGRIEIPRIGVTAIVREGYDSTTLTIAVGHISGTAQPGERGNMVLAGHRDSFFRGLQDIRSDDTIRLVTQERSYEYSVRSTEIVSPDNTSVLEPTTDTVLSLITCFPFDYVGHAPKRFIVHAALIEPLALTGRVSAQASARGNGFAASSLAQGGRPPHPPRRSSSRVSGWPSP